MAILCQALHLYSIHNMSIVMGTALKGTHDVATERNAFFTCVLVELARSLYC